MKYNMPPGVFDILPNAPKQPWQNSWLWQYVENAMREIALQFGYKEIRTPLFEKTELFQRSVGETSDIISKEMYSFEDRGGRMLSLRPEGTAPVMRSFIDNHLQNSSSIHKLFYIGPMFRYERSQAGRYRQHHQFGVEAIGISSPEQDVELISLLYTLYKRLGLHNLEVQINTIGSLSCREAYKKAYITYLQTHLKNLSKESQERISKNPLRILDSKAPEDREINKGAPSLLDFVGSKEMEHFKKILTLLDSIEIPYTVTPTLIRGLDYYNYTVFEIVAQELGAQNSIGAGGRYDGLLKALGGPDLPAAGFGTGIERIIQTLLNQAVTIPEEPRPILYMIPLGDHAKNICFQLLQKLRDAKIPAQMEFSNRKLGKAMSYANQIRAKFTTVIGDNELENKIVELKEMDSGKYRKAPLFHLARILQFEANYHNYMNLWEEITAPFDQPGQAEFFVDKINESINQTKEIAEKLQTAMQSMKELL